MNSRIEFKKFATPWTIGASIPGVALVISVVLVHGVAKGYSGNFFSLSGVGMGLSTVFGGWLNALIWAAVLSLFTGAVIGNRVLFGRGHPNWASVEMTAALVIIFGLGWWQLQIDGGMGGMLYIAVTTIIATAIIWGLVWAGVQLANKQLRHTPASTAHSWQPASPISPVGPRTSAGSTNPTSQPTPNSPTTHR